MTHIVSIHFASPPNDPLKLPRPIHLSEVNGALQTRGGEVAGQLLFFTDQENPDDVISTIRPTELFEKMVDIIEIPGTLAHKVVTDEWKGWMPVSTDDGEWSTYTALKIDRVEVRR